MFRLETTNGENGETVNDKNRIIVEKKFAFGVG